jgi:hypothetical protein
MRGIVVNKLEEIFGKMPWEYRNENLARKSKDLSNVSKRPKGE